ncbi:MAG: beta-N-acetylhexosaminidase [Bacteroidaceae bacterium]|nr:beta-N-acetylhexosaminidase [Bacteroidaceae bacterium]
MRKFFLLLSLLLALPLVTKAEVFVSEHMSVVKGAQQRSAVKADAYYIISGIDQANIECYLYDNGGQVKGSSNFVAKGESTSSFVWTLQARGSEWLIKNVGTGAIMNLGGSNGSAVGMAQTEQTNAIHFGADGFVTILNANGQAVDMTANGANPTTWAGTTTPNGSRRLKIYAVDEWTVEPHRSLSLIPAPKSAVVGDGEFALQSQLSINVENFVETETHQQILADAVRFITTLSSATGVDCQATTGAADIVISENQSLAPEGYVLEVSEAGVRIEASTSDGAYYALQTLLRLLPSNVVLGKADAACEKYALPVVRIEDEPRFAYRGFMLDVSRHFFTIEQVKKMLDLMAIYKMNVFHWHLTDDQGWRAEIKQYPLLTTVGAERRSSYDTPITRVEENGQVYWTGEGAQTNRKYGPFFYTQEEMKDVVRYAAERHIDVLPEVDMPGHFVAALAAYPEFSCHPSYAPEVWINGGVSADVLNVANPAAVQFAKNIITELCTIFPYPYFHIGGDECPTSQWETNAQCQAKLAQLGKSSFRALQTEFIREINEHLATLGKKIFCWNESVTDAGADLELMKQSGATIMCWNPCQSGAAKAASLGLDAIITEWGSGCYYINRRQSNDYGEPTAAGGGGDNVAATYNYVPVPANVSAEAAKHYIGVQATFWAEHVSSNEYLEYLALPRLMCIAESGWTEQEQKSWKSFVRRMTVDTRMLDLGEYIYARHWMDNYVPRKAPASALSDGRVVTFTNKSADRGQCLADNGGVLNAQGSVCTEWTLEAAETEGLFYIRSNVSGKYLYAANGNSGTAVELSDAKTAWAFDTSTSPGYVAICYNATSGNAINNNVNNATKARLFAHGTGNGASFWAVEADADNNLKEGEQGELTYKYYYRGLTVGTKVFALTAGEAYPSAAEFAPEGFVVESAAAPEGTMTLKHEAKEIVVKKVPVSGRFYTFSGSSLKRYLSADAATLQTFGTKEADVNSIFYYADEALMAYDCGLFLNGAVLAEAGAPGAAISIVPSAAGTMDYCNIVSADADYLRMYSNVATANTVGSLSLASKSKLYDFSPRMVLTLPVAVGEAGWTTFSAPVAVTIPEGCVAYAVEAAEAGELNLRALTSGTAVAAQTGLLLSAEPLSIVEFVISETGYECATNALQPAVASTIVDAEGAYVFSIAGDKGVFTKVGVTTATLPAHSSWLLMADGAAADVITIDLPGMVTGIGAIEADTAAKATGIFNLQGQQLSAPQRGVNIINGRKVVVK